MNKSGKTVREKAGMMAAVAMMISVCASRKKKVHGKKKSFTVEGFPSTTPSAHTCAHARRGRVRANSALVLHVSSELEEGWLQSLLK